MYSRGGQINLPQIQMGKRLNDISYSEKPYEKNVNIYQNRSRLPSIKLNDQQRKNSILSKNNDKNSDIKNNDNNNEEKSKNENNENYDNDNKSSIQNTTNSNQNINNDNQFQEKNKWWVLLRDFVFLYKFILTSKKYVRYALKRNRYIKDRYHAIKNDIEILKEWIIDIEKPFIDIFQKYERVNIRFRNHDSEIKINKKSEQLYKLIKIFMENLIGNTKKLSDIPQEIQNILYEYIREKGYYARKYLTSFQYNRLDFDFYGRTRYMNDKRGGLILAFLIISGITVQQILLHLHELFPKYNNNPYIISNCKYIGSLLHFLTRDTFKNNPQIQNDGLSLINYYRNYHINDNEVKNQKNIYPNYKIFKDKDQFAQFLVSESKITPVWEINPSFVETYKKFIFEWAVNLSKILRIKYVNYEYSMKNKRKSSSSTYK